MKLQAVTRQKQRLDAVFAKIGAFQGDPELQAHWAAYLCVLVSGFTEEAIRQILLEYARRQSSPHVANYIDAQLQSFQNPKMERILILVRAFSPSWEQDLKQKTEGRIKDAVDSIVANRHLIAHGRTATSLSYVRVKEYYDGVIDLIDLLETQCGL